MKKFNKVISIFLTVLFISLVIFLNIGTIAIINQNIDYLEFSKILTYFGIILLIIYILYRIFNKKKIGVYEILILLLSIFGYISYYYAIDQGIALNGTVSRNEGLLVILTYYIIFLCSSILDKKYQRIVIDFVLIFGIFQIGLGTIQILGIQNIFGYDRSINWSNLFSAASGTFGNPNFYSTYILMCLLYSYGNFIKNKNKILYFILSFIFFYGIIIGNTFSCILAFFIILFFTLIIGVNKNNFKNYLIGLIFIFILVLISIGVLDIYTNDRISRVIHKNFEEVFEIFDGGINDKTGNYRIEIWRKTISKLPEYIYTGIGIDNFENLNNGSYLCAGDAGVDFQCFDKAHNEYLQKLITEGIFSFICYLLLIVYICFNFIKNKRYNDSCSYSLFLIFIGYLIQAFFNISVIPVAPIFWIIMGFIIKE